MNGKLLEHEEDDPIFNYLECCNSMAVSWITHTLSPQSVVYINNAKVLWDKLCHQFTKCTNFKLFDHLQEIYSMEQRE